MATIIELQKYIRFQLSQLKAQNKHHEFETLSRYFAKATICSNILPATGPVGSGGDQGRDAETFRTYLQSTPIANSAFVGFTTDKKIVFCCSLNKEIEGKIKDDVVTVTSSGSKVDAIHYFCEADLPVAKRHKLEEWAKEQHNVALEIIDGQALSELLTNIDVFWIAEEFLSVPSEMYPKSKNTETQYAEYKKIWLDNKKPPHNLADFIQLKYGLREATFNPDVRTDLTSWIKVMERFLEKGVAPFLRRKAIYEVCVATLRGLNRLSERKSLIEEYFSALETLDEPAELRDIFTLLSYCSTATAQGHYEGDPNEFYNLTNKLTQHLDDLLANSTNPGIKCRLLEIRGHLGALVFRDGPKPKMPDFDESLKFWELLVKEVPKAPLYPLESLSDFLVGITEFIDVSDALKDLMRDVEKLLATRSGDFLPAEKCRDRAVIMLERENYLAAIRELHSAKVKWFAAETLRGSLLSMMILAECYQQLGLLYAAKYYCSAVAVLAYRAEDERLRTFVAKALLRLSGYSFQAGEWFSSALVMEGALLAHNTYDNDPWEFTGSKDLQYTMSHYLITKTVLERFSPNAKAFYNEVTKKWQIPPDIAETLEQLLSDKTVFWYRASESEIIASLAKEFYGQPCCDLGKVREISWKALGITWVVTFKNEYKTTLIAEEIVSTIQIVTADIADKDLLFLPTTARIKINLTQDSKFTVENSSSNVEGVWEVFIPENWILEDNYKKQLHENVDKLAISIFAECSAIKSESFIKTLDKLFTDGLPSKTFAVRPYSDLYHQFVGKEQFERIARKDLKPLFSAKEFLHDEVPALRWNDSISPSYSKKNAKEFLENRYKKAIRPIRLSLPLLLQDDAFYKKMLVLKGKGYKDWMILLIVMNIVVNYRVHNLLGNARPEIISEETLNLINREETKADTPIPPEIFTDERIKQAEAMTYGAIAKTWGLEIRNNCPDIEAWIKLLNTRFKNNIDDISHDNFFNWDR